MASPNQQLEAVLQQFASQPGVTPDQVAQLRAAVIGDAQQLAQLNREAQAGQLTGFALQSAASPTPNLAGTYDLQSGVVTLPATSFQPSGAAASPDLTATVKLQQMSIEFAHKTYNDAANVAQPVTQDMVNNLQATINGSPALAVEIKRAATTLDPGDPQRRAHLEHFDFVDPNQMAAGGTYSGRDKVMSLPALGLQTSTPANPLGRYNADDMTFVLGHEIQHGFNHPDKMQAALTFHNDSVAIAKSAQPIHDYTAQISAQIQAARNDEAKAEIAGWNALQSRQEQLHPGVGLPAMYQVQTGRIYDFVTQPTATEPQQPLSGLTFNPDGSLSQSPANVAAMGQHYFDKPDHAHALPGRRSLGIGQRGTSDYPNYYGNSAVENVVAWERQFANPVHGVMPQMQINMAGARLSEELLEKEGIDLRTNKTPKPYYDSSQTPAVLHHFDHTQDGSVAPAQDHQFVPIAPSAPGRRGADDLDDADRALLDKIRGGVRELDQQTGKPWDDHSERMSASLLTLAADKKFTAGDDLKVAFNNPTASLAAGEIVHLYREGGASPDPAANRAYMTTAQALAMPAEQRYTQVETIRNTQAQTAQMEQQHALTNSMNAQSQSGPVMSM